MPVLGALLAFSVLLVAACGEPVACGPDQAVVSRAIDGDTIELASGERVRYLLVDTPESTLGHDECFGAEAYEFNRNQVEGRVVSLRYEPTCRDRYGRLLAYVSVGGQELNSLLLRSGFACVLHIPPSGDERVAEFQALQRQAQILGRGLWSACATNPCD